MLLDEHQCCINCVNNMSPIIHEVLLCESCYTNVKGVCKSCNKEKDLLIDDSICIDCRFSEGWDEDPSMRARMCAQCNKNTYVSPSGICRSCFVENSIASSKFFDLKKCGSCEEYIPLQRTRCLACEAKLKVCPKCDSKFSPRIPTQVICDDCLPKCASPGCNTRLADINEIYCDDCTKKREAFQDVLNDGYTTHELDDG